jgi:hypothetical protein
MYGHAEVNEKKELERWDEILTRTYQNESDSSITHLILLSVHAEEPEI